MEDCLFCKIVNNELPSYIIREDEATLSILDLYPSSKYQTLVIPKRHTESSFTKADPIILEKTFQAARETAALLESKLPELERVIVMIEGLAIPHLHIRLHPHQYETYTLVGGEGKKANEEELKRIYELLTRK